MPVRWKKAEISRLVADHLHSRRRGDSLVVETGFPTSLIDLFVKNRDRLKKQSKKKRFESPDLTPSPSPSPLPLPLPGNSQTDSPSRCVSVSDSLNSKRNSSVSDSLNSNRDSLSGTDDEIQRNDRVRVSRSDFLNPRLNSSSEIADEVLRKDVIGDSLSDSSKPKRNSSSKIADANEITVGGELDEGGFEIADSNRLLLGIMMMSLIVVFALCTKKMTVGITMSAILLIFLEYLGKHACELLKPCAKAEKSFGSVIQMVLGLFGIKQAKFLDLKARNRQVQSELNIADEEIQIVLPPIDGFECAKDESETLGCDRKLGCLEVEKEGNCVSDVTEMKARRSRRAKIKSNMKKLVPKKLRSSKKKRMDLEVELTSFMGNDKVAKCEEHKQEEDGESSSFLSSGRSAFDVDDQLAHTELVETAVETERNSETITRNSGYLIFFLIVLVGLFGGRVLAISITMLWCLLMKSAGTLRRYMKVLMIQKL